MLTRVEETSFVASVSREEYRRLLGDRPWWVENPAPELLTVVLPHLSCRQRSQLERNGGKFVLPSVWTPFVTHVGEFTPAANSQQSALLYVVPYGEDNRDYFSSARFEEEARRFVDANWAGQAADLRAAL